MDVQILRPIGAGDRTGLPRQYPTSGEHWDKVDDVTPDDDGTYVHSRDAIGYTGDLYRLPNLSGNIISISSVREYVRTGCFWGWPGGLAADEAFFFIKTHGSEYSGYDYSIGTVPTCEWHTRSRSFSKNPYTNQPWTVQEVNGLQAGVKLSMGPFRTGVSCTQVYVEVTYTPGVAFSPNESPTAIATITVMPAGLSCSAELWLALNGSKVATSGLIPFTSTGASQSINLPITMPSAPGTYPVWLDIFAEGMPIGAYIGDEDVVILPG